MAESEFADHQTSRTAPGTSVAEWTFSSVRCWPAKLAAMLSSSTADDRTANGGGNAAMAFASFSMALSSPEAMASTRSPESATPGGTGRPWRVASPSPMALDPNSDRSVALLNGTAFFIFTQVRLLRRHHRQRGRGHRRQFVLLLRGFPQRQECH